MSLQLETIHVDPSASTRGLISLYYDFGGDKRESFPAWCAHQIHSTHTIQPNDFLSMHTRYSRRIVKPNSLPQSRHDPTAVYSRLQPPPVFAGVKSVYYR